MDIAEIANMALDISLEIILILVFVFALSKTKWFRPESTGFLNAKNTLAYILIFGLLMIFATNYLYGTYNDAFINVRNLGAMIAGLMGGPAVGLGAGLIGGFDRLLLGGTVALPCAFATIISGLIGGLVWIVVGKRYPKIYIAAIVMLIMECIHMILIALISNPPSAGVDVVYNIAIPQMIFNVGGIIIFSLFYQRYIRSKDAGKVSE